MAEASVGDGWKWALIGVAGLVALGMAVRSLMRLRGGSESRADAPPGTSKIERIKRYREQHGVGLKQAKDAVEAELAGAPLALLPSGLHHCVGRCPRWRRQLL
jgi:hypothetical protein